MGLGRGEQPLSRRRILWVDDDLFFYQGYLGEVAELYQVVSVRDPDACWRRLSEAEAGDFAGIIMDVILPTGEHVDHALADGGLRTGLVLIEMLKASTLFRDIPIVIFTIREAGDVDVLGAEYKIPVLRKTEVTMHEFIQAVQNAFG